MRDITQKGGGAEAPPPFYCPPSPTLGDGIGSTSDDRVRFLRAVAEAEGIFQGQQLHTTTREGLPPIGIVVGSRARYLSRLEGHRGCRAALLLPPAEVVHAEGVVER